MEVDWMEPFDQDGEERKQHEAEDEDRRGPPCGEGELVAPARSQDGPGKVKRGGGGARMRSLGDPRLPSSKEVEEHYLTHVPYRNWCPHCIRGRGKDLDHRRALDDERKIREFSFDYCFPGDEKGVRVTVLVGRERVTGMTMASVVPTKGTSGQFAVMKVLEFIRECGAEEADIILKTDQEPAIDALMKDVVKTRGEKITMLEKSPVGSSGSNGVVERGVQSVEGVIRTLLSALEERIGIRIRIEERIVVFVAAYAAYLINRLEVGKDGKTAYERNKGKQGTVMAVEFGEKLLYKMMPRSKMEKINPRWEYGVFVGVKAVSGEIWVATKSGVRAVRSVRRIAAEERWKAENKDWVQHVPWNMGVDDADADGEIPDGPAEDAPLGENRSAEARGSGDPPRVVVVNTRQVPPREFYIQKKDLEKHGHTRGCAGCRTMIQGGTRQAHTTECRERFRRVMQDDGKVQKMHEKRKEYEERMTKKEDKRKKKEEERGTKRRAEHDDIEEERIREAVPGEEKGLKRKADDDEIERERIREHAAANDEGMAIEAVYGEQAWDDVRGGELDWEQVQKARLEEVEYMRKRGLWKVVPRAQAEGKKVTSVKWVDTNKGTEEDPMIRCRLVARDFRAADRDREDLFAATPPWELKKLLMSQAAFRGDGRKRKILLIDVKKAHLNPECKDEVYVELPEEVGAKPDQIGKLDYWLYGFRPAAAAWENHYADNLVSVGFRRGEATPVAFYNKAKDISLVVHGDDFTFVGEDDSLDWIEQHMKRWYEVKIRARLGHDEHDDKEATLLGRIVKWETWGITCEADPKHRRLVMDALGLEETSKRLTVPGNKDDGKMEEKPKQEEEQEKNPADHTRFRAIAARLNYMAADMPDVQFACKEACREMSAPTEGSWRKVKKLGRYLVGRPRVLWQYPWKSEVGIWKVYTDSDWAGNTVTRKSTSGGILMLGTHCMKTWSVTQDPLALSSCEAEYYAIVEGVMEAAAKGLGAVVEGATRALGLQASARELGIMVDDIVVDVATDSSSAKSFASRRGSGRIRHVEVKWLWLQRAVADGKVRLRKILGTTNPADVCTKYQSITEITNKLRAVGICVEQKTGGQESKLVAFHSQEASLGTESSWARLQRGGKRIQWADASDSGGEGHDEEIDDLTGMELADERDAARSEGGARRASGSQTGSARGGVLNISPVQCSAERRIL